MTRPLSADTKMQDVVTPETVQNRNTPPGITRITEQYAIAISDYNHGVRNRKALYKNNDLGDR